MTRTTGFIGSRGIFGILLVSLGALFLISNYFRGFYWDEYWPLMFVVWGAARFAAYGAYRWGFSVALMIVGLLVFYGGFDDPFYVFDILEWDVIWPLAVIALGGYMVVRNINARGRAEAASSSEKDTLSAYSVLGSNNARIVSHNFSGGSALAFLGGVEIDMREARLAADKDIIKIDVTAVLGSVEIYAPADWVIKTRGLPLLGSIEDQRPNPPRADEAAKTLIVDGIAILGSVEIKP